MGYENTDCFVVCFSVVDMVTFSNVKNVWLKELKQNAPADAKIILAGTKADLRGKGKEMAGDRYSEVPLKKIRRLVRDEKLAGYVETSAKNGGEDVDRVFHEAIKVALGVSSGGVIDNRCSQRSSCREKAWCSLS